MANLKVVVIEGKEISIELESSGAFLRREDWTPKIFGAILEKEGLKLTSAKLDIAGSLRQLNGSAKDIFAVVNALRKLDISSDKDLRKEFPGGINQAMLLSGLEKLY